MHRIVASAAIAVGLASLASHDARAGACAAPPPRVFAIGAKLARNGVVLLDVSRAVLGRLEVNQANLLGAAKLVGGGSAVPVTVLRFVEGGRIQALIAPAKPLPANAKVHLETGQAELDAGLAAQELVTSAELADGKPAWSKPPSTDHKHRVVPSNKGDDVDTVSVELALEAPAFVLVKISDKDTTRVAIYVADGTHLAIGATGCTSMIAGIRRGERVELTAIGAGGQEVAAPGNALRF